MYEEAVRGLFVLTVGIIHALEHAAKCAIGEHLNSDISQLSTCGHPRLAQTVLHEWITIFKQRGLP